jgi:hypothetical protein
MSTIETLVDEIAEFFAGVVHPGEPHQICEVPCCPDHDALADWLSRHTWEELAEDLEESDYDLGGAEGGGPKSSRIRGLF